VLAHVQQSDILIVGQYPHELIAAAQRSIWFRTWSVSPPSVSAGGMTKYSVSRPLHPHVEPQTVRYVDAERRESCLGVAGRCRVIPRQRSERLLELL